MELREYITKRRKELGISQSQMASALGYTDTAVSKIESGASNPPISILPSLANELQLSLDDLLSKAESPAPLAAPNPAYDSKKVAANIRALRLSRRLRQKEAAEQFGVNKRTLVTYEKGDACPNLLTFDRLLAFCPGKPSEFFYGQLFPEIQASPSFKKRGPSPFFVFLVGFLVGAGILGGSLAPFALANGKASSSNGQFGFNSTSTSGSSSSSDGGNSPSPEQMLKDDLCLITTSGYSKDAWIKRADSGKTSSLDLTIYTGSGAYFTSAMRENTVFEPYIAAEPTSGTAKLSASGTKYIWTLTIDSGVNIPNTIAVGVKAYWNGSKVAIEGKPLDVTVNDTGSL